VARGARATEVLVEGAEVVTTMARVGRGALAVGRVGLVLGRALLRAIPETLLIELMMRGVIAIAQMEAYDEYERPALQDQRIGPRITRGLADMTANIVRVLRGQAASGADAAIATQCANDQIAEWLANDPQLTRADIAANFREAGMWRGVFDAIAPAWRGAADRRALELCPRPRETEILVERFRRRVEAARPLAGQMVGE